MRLSHPQHILRNSDQLNTARFDFSICTLNANPNTCPIDNMVEFNTQIVQPNISDPYSLQHNWAVIQAGCLRPSADYGVPVVCQVKKEPFRSDILGTEFDVFKPCCSSLTGNTTMWVVAEPCETEYCFTANTTIAAGFDECIVNAASAHYKELDMPAPNDTSADLPYRGECEWIDYDSIKKGIRTSDQLGAATALSPRLGARAVFVIAVAASVLTSGLL
ncbi:hypothetical protein F5Y18DRAFT_306261 [Xylariaceae sp. FL1019]|nr:hypothetical protein F5Y18DRAFT_306261 [Xylariaceae sp. FL1019]